MSTSPCVLLTLLLLFSNFDFFFSKAHASDNPNNPPPGDHAIAQFELIHRDSPELAEHFGNTTPNITTLERFERIAERDNARMQTIIHRLGGQRRQAFEVRKGSRLVQIPIRSAADTGSGEYFVSVRVGSPPQKFILIADTGSSLTWMNCRYRCRGCSRGIKTPPGRLFVADQSPTFKTIPCMSHICKVELADSFSLAKCPMPTAPCFYDYRYADGTRVVGFFANETLTVGLSDHQKVKLHNVMIGCSEMIEGDKFNEIDGIMGLGYDKHSFAVRASKMFDNKFSYCLVDHLSPPTLVNYLAFGGIKGLTLPNMQHTQLILGVVNPFYALNVSGISVGGKMLAIPSKIWDVCNGGGAILDSGSSLTYLPQPAYDEVMAALEAPLVKFKKAAGRGPFEYCFREEGFREASVPQLAIHFADGAKFVPPVKSYVLDVEMGVKCLGFTSAAWPGASVIGNILQQNHLWEFDLLNAKVGFAPSSCKFN